MTSLRDADRSGPITVQEFDGTLTTQCDRSGSDLCVLFLDVETTGLSYENDRIIQLALRPVFVNRESFKVSHCAGMKVIYNDPGFKISDEIIALTGVTNENVKGCEIDWTWLAGIVERVDLVVCHNAKFDRNFVMRHLQEADISEPSTIWGCSFRQINWASVCRASQALEVLCAWHGFYYQAHDAGNDVNALIHLLVTSDRMGELLTAAEKSQWRVFAVDLPFEKKDEIKARRYQWDGEVRMWSINMSDRDTADAEMKYLTDTYNIKPQLFEIEPRYLFA